MAQKLPLGCQNLKTNMKQNLNTTNLLPNFDFVTPIGYRLLWDRKIIGFNEGNSALDPWYYLDSGNVFDLTRKWPSHSRHGSLIAFARRYDSDDLACFEVNSAEVQRVLVVHGWTDEGYDVVASYENFWVWVKAVVDDIALSIEDGV